MGGDTTQSRVSDLQLSNQAGYMPETPLMPGINYSQNVRALQFLAIGGLPAKP